RRGAITQRALPQGLRHLERRNVRLVITEREGLYALVRVERSLGVQVSLGIAKIDVLDANAKPVRDQTVGTRRRRLHDELMSALGRAEPDVLRRRARVEPAAGQMLLRFPGHRARSNACEWPAALVPLQRNQDHVVRKRKAAPWRQPGV